jgi:hypothetical protein
LHRPERGSPADMGETMAEMLEFYLVLRNCDDIKRIIEEFYREKEEEFMKELTALRCESLVTGA